MQMALPSAMRLLLLCFLERLLVAPGVSLHSFLSQSSVDPGIPANQQVTTIYNLQNGLGVVRPTPPPAASQPAASQPAASQPAQASVSQAADAQADATPPAASDSGFVKINPRTAANSGPASGVGFKIEAKFEMRSTSPDLLDEYDNSPTGFALTLADRLRWATNVPMSRFAFYLPHPQASGDTVLFCMSDKNEGSVGAAIARFASTSNSTFSCKSETYRMNSTSPPVSLLQQKKRKALSFEVGVYPPSGEYGDRKPAVQVADAVVSYASGSDEPERKLLPTGLWSYKAGPALKFHGLFPATLAVLPGGAYPLPRETSLPLGPNPGGQGAERPPAPVAPGPPCDCLCRSAHKAVKTSDGWFCSSNTVKDEKCCVSVGGTPDIDSVLAETKTINDRVRNSLQELKDSLARASAVHSAWMNTDVYQLPTELVGH